MEVHLVTVLAPKLKYLSVYRFQWLRNARRRRIWPKKWFVISFSTNVDCDQLYQKPTKADKQYVLNEKKKTWELRMERMLLIVQYHVDPITKASLLLLWKIIHLIEFGLVPFNFHALMVLRSKPPQHIEQLLIVNMFKNCQWLISRSTNMVTIIRLKFRSTAKWSLNKRVKFIVKMRWCWILLLLFVVIPMMIICGARGAMYFIDTVGPDALAIEANR